jgi:hypothetical protein
MPVVPFKLNQDYCNHIPPRRYKVTNWPTYEASLRQRCKWFSDEAVATWAADPRRARGGRLLDSAWTIRALGAAFRLAFRQAEGLIGLPINLFGLTLRVPDCTGLKLCDASKRLVEKHGTKTCRSWKKLHLGVDVDAGQIMDSTLAGNTVRVDPLLDQVAGLVASFTADRAYDQDDVYAEAGSHPDAVVIAPRRTRYRAKWQLSCRPAQPSYPVQHRNGLMAWQKACGYTGRQGGGAVVG